VRGAPFWIERDLALTPAGTEEAVTQLAADRQAAALVNETIAFELNAAAAHFDRQGQPNVAQALRQQAATLLADASRLRSEAEEPTHGNTMKTNSTELRVEDEPAVPKVILDRLKNLGFSVLAAGAYACVTSLLV